MVRGQRGGTAPGSAAREQVGLEPARYARPIRAGSYLDRYAEPDKGFTDRSDAWWPAPYWDIDTGFASLLMLLTAVDAGLGACFFGMPLERIDSYREAFGVPEEFRPIGAISIGYPDEPARDLSARRRPSDELIHRGRWAG